MKNNYVVGNVVSVDGMKVNILMNEHSNLESFHYDGAMYDGISIGSYIGIIRGSNKIIGRVEKEFLEDKSNEPLAHEFFRDRFERHLEVSLIGNIYKSNFEFGIKRFPMIFNEVVLLTDDEIRCVLQKDSSISKYRILIGKSVSNGIPVELAWDNLFNTHMGIFGNTGSGKSNTLTKLYTELFSHENHEILVDFNNNSKFVIIDFNGEYIQPGVLRDNKKCLNLSTRNNDGDKLPLTPRVFWDIETLSILYSATEKTQRPFLARAVKYFVDEGSFDITADKIVDGLSSAFYNIFKQNNNKEMLNLLHKSLDIIHFDMSQKYSDDEQNSIDISWLNSLWHSQNDTYYVDGTYISSIDDSTKRNKRREFEKILKRNEFIKNIERLTVTEKLKITVNSYLIFCLAYGKVNFEHINPLIQRIEARSSFIEKTICLSSDSNEWDLLNVISFRRCNSEAKKMIPLLIAKQLYEEHKEKITGENEITSTIHLIIDEAHNILSAQSTREKESWKDYRLEVFEEIIKEGRKFGFFITLSSQRPYDISPTIISQLHNYFIHRLVNEQDLRMIANTVNFLDPISRSQIPNLAPGQCIITGTSFEMPLLVQVSKLDKEKSPSSENADLVKLWIG
ncbi:ATP-binding protein [Megasphaera coli]|uniref:ATP-binding protein n=1 Tax=Colibacter massiliensis TaxID=1852379 RepID=UPI00094EA721|nr:ATP-binding protein [Colibacter massiliensis]